MTKVPESEALRYLGAAGAQDAALRDMLGEVCALYEKRVTPKAVWREFDCTVTEDAVSFGGITFEGADLARHLKDCTVLLVFAATLGVEGDRLARAEQLRSTARGAMAHAVGAAMIEQFCDDTQESIAEEYEKRGLFLRPRYSPGYGDLPLSRQVDVFRLLDIEKRLGLRLSDDYTMMPSKSVTALIGISEKKGRSFRRCMNCKKTDCPFRREG